MSAPRVFGVDYQFLACGDVFTQGLASAAADLGVVYSHAESRNSNLAALVDRFRPDALVVVHGRYATPRLRDQVKRYPAAIWLLDEPYEVDDTARFSSVYTRAFVNDAARSTATNGAPTCPSAMTATRTRLARARARTRSGSSVGPTGRATDTWPPSRGRASWDMSSAGSGPVPR